jgi:hypothetical protein
MISNRLQEFLYDLQYQGIGSARTCVTREDSGFAATDVRGRRIGFGSLRPAANRASSRLKSVGWSEDAGASILR